MKKNIREEVKAMESKYHYIRGSGVRKLAKEYEKQVSSDFLAALDRAVYTMIIKACKMSNQIKRLDAGLIE